MTTFAIVDDDDQVLPTAETLTKEDGQAHKNRPRVDQERYAPVDVEEPLRCADEVPDETLYNQTQLAKHFKMSRNLVIERLEDAGIEPAEDNGPRGRKYRLSDVESVLVHKVLKSDRKLQATERKLEAEAELKEIEVQKKRGEVIAVSDVELGAVQLFRSLHTRLVQYCDDSALDISRLRTRGEVAAYQKDRIGKILQELRNDPNNALSKWAADEQLG